WGGFRPGGPSPFLRLGVAVIRSIRTVRSLLVVLVVAASAAFLVPGGATASGSRAAHGSRVLVKQTRQMTVYRNSNGTFTAMFHPMTPRGKNPSQPFQVAASG